MRIQRVYILKFSQQSTDLEFACKLREEIMPGFQHYIMYVTYVLQCHALTCAFLLV